MIVRRTRFDLIANQMMKGGFARLYKKNKVATDPEIAAFKEIHGATIRWVEENLPKYINGGVLGAFGKAVLWYGKDRMLPFAQQLLTGNFKGRFDPAHVLFLWLNRNASKDTRDAYRRTVAAIRYFLAGKKLVRLYNGEEQIDHIAPAGTDIFEWDGNYTVMVPPKYIGLDETKPRSIYEGPTAEEFGPSLTE